MKNLYKITQLQFELCTKIPRVSCLAHDPIGKEDNSTYLLTDDLKTDPISQVHYMFEHPSAERTRNICRCYNLKSIRKLEQKAFDFLRNCTFCRQAKGKMNSFAGAINRPNILGQQWYADIKVLFDTPSHVHENVYVFGIIKAKSRYLLQFYIKMNSDVEKCLCMWYINYILALKLVFESEELRYNFFNTDIGECTSDAISFLNNVGIKLTTTCPHTPEQSMMIERVWRTIGESAITMLLTADLSESYWEEARKTAFYLYNRSPSAHTDVITTFPYEQYYGSKPQVINLRVLGSTCYPANLVKNKGNHEPKA